MENKNISKNIREMVYKNCNGKCYFCGKDLSSKEFLNNQYHHYKPQICGGKTEVDNIVLCCYECHKIMHSKMEITYNSLRRSVYKIFCNLLDILPCNNSFDDDLLSAEEDLRNGKEVPEKWRKLILAMKLLDKNCGLIDLKIKIGDLAKLSGIKIKNKPKTIQDFELLELDINDFINKYNLREIND